MASVPSDCLYYKNSILGNARIFLDQTAIIDVVTAVDPSGTWHAHLIKTEAGTRSCVLTETAGDVQNALQKLHVKSAQALHRFTQDNNGFGFPPIVNLSSSSSSRGDQGKGSVVIAFNDDDLYSEEDEHEASDSDESLVGRANRRGTQRCSRRRVAAEAVSRRSIVARSDNSDDDHDDANVSDQQHAHARRETCSPRRCKPAIALPCPPPRPATHRAAPLPPPPGWMNFQQPPVRPPLPPPGLRTVSPLPPLGRQPPTAIVPPQGFMPPSRPAPVLALLSINWVGHGRKKIVLQAAPTEESLRNLAMREVCLRPSGFMNPPPPPQGSPPRPPPPPGPLTATIRSVTLGEETYEFVTAGFINTFKALFGNSSSGDIPKFEIDVASMWPASRAHDESDGEESDISNDG